MVAIDDQRSDSTSWDERKSGDEYQNLAVALSSENRWLNRMNGSRVEVFLPKRTERISLGQYKQLRAVLVDANKVRNMSLHNFGSDRTI